ncbi:MAG: hypothetical protein DRI57_15535 [Deltaproteobacteria bacterium]|nr:MAG: hypothetical protein DRI57_15535 [Deltaproteobacteria bacterium]
MITRDRSIVTRIVSYACGVVFVLLILGSYALIKFEISLVETFTDERLEKINQSIDDREKRERLSLQKKVRFNTGILSKMSVLFLDNFNPEGLKQSLSSYMNYPETVAVKVLDEDGEPFAAAWSTPDITVPDEDGEPFAAAWKAPDIIVGDALPDDLRLENTLSVQADVVRDGKKWGSLKVYYTDAIISKKIRAAKKNASIESERFKDTSQLRLESAIIKQVAGVLLILLILIFCLTLLLRSLVIGPLNMVSDIAHILTDFDLSVSIDTDRNDEIGRLLTAIDKMVLEFRKIVGDVKSGGERLSGASDQMTENISAIASAAEEISVNVQSVSHSTEEMLQRNVTVASSIEEMSSAMNEVGMNAYQGSCIAGDAVAMADKAGNTMSSLGEAANDIGEVTEVIKRIADETTLLALNADIEAASAGDAGRGFAVVANEIKEFARQSTLAADNIADRISGIQEGVKEAVDVIGDVSGIIDKINHSSETVSLALENQMKAANEIASNAGQANIRARNIALSMEELAKGANEVSMRVGLAAGGKEGETDGRYIDASAAQVARLARELLELVRKFKVE